jgi:hypothetical protein
VTPCLPLYDHIYELRVLSDAYQVAYPPLSQSLHYCYTCSKVQVPNTKPQNFPPQSTSISMPSAMGGRQGGGSGHHCIRDCTSKSTKLCIRKGHKAWCTICGDLITSMYGCSGCKVKGSEYQTTKNPNGDYIPEHEKTAIERQKKREEKEKTLKKKK